MSKYENQRHLIEMDAPLLYVEREEYEKLWNDLEAVDRFGHEPLASQGIEAIWDYERRKWVTFK